jgi:hypothetical protein
VDVRRQFLLSTQFTFGSLTFAMREDGNLKMLHPRASTRAPYTGIWTSFMFFGHLIYNTHCLLRFGFLCRASYPHRQACSGYPDHDVYLLAISWGIELILIDNVLRLRFSSCVTEPPQKWGVCLPRSYRRILDEAGMRKHTQISIQYQIWNSS